MKIKNILTAALLSASFGVAFAGGIEEEVIDSGFSPAGFYLGASLGFGGLDTPDDYLSNTHLYTASTQLRDGIAWRVDVGYLFPLSGAFNVGAEIGYNGYPDNNYILDTYSLEYSSFAADLLGVVKWSLGSFNLIGKVGGAYVRQTAEANYPYRVRAGLSSGELTDSGFLPEIAFGLGYNFNYHFAVEVIYTHIFGDDPNFNISYGLIPGDGNVNQVASINTLLLGVSYLF